MNFLKTTAFLLGFAALGLACGSSSDGPADPIKIGGKGGAGGSRADAYIAPGTGGAGAGGAIVDIDGGAGGAVVIDSGAGGATGTVDANADVGSGVPAVEIHKQIINAATTSVALTVAGPAAVPYTSCR